MKAKQIWKNALGPVGGQGESVYPLGITHTKLRKPRDGESQNGPALLHRVHATITKEVSQNQYKQNKNTERWSTHPMSQRRQLLYDPETWWKGPEGGIMRVEPASLCPFANIYVYKGIQGGEKGRQSSQTKVYGGQEKLILQGPPPHQPYHTPKGISSQIPKQNLSLSPSSKPHRAPGTQTMTINARWRKLLDLLAVQVQDRGS